MTKFKIEFTNYFDRKLVSDNPNKIYLFTDNLRRTSGKNMLNQSCNYVQRWRARTVDIMPINHYFPTMTQAIIRGLDNAFPITTMKDNYRTQLSSDDLSYMKLVWKTEIEDILEYARLHDIDTIVCSNRIYGKGSYSNLNDELFNALRFELMRLNINNTIYGVYQLE